jgi:hypothetical protein
MYFAFAAIYVVLVAIFILDVLRQPASALSGVGKAIWIVDRPLCAGRGLDRVRVLAHQAVAPLGSRRCR